MLWSRIVGALMFRAAAYEDVESDPTFTRTAWMIVAVVSLLVRLASGAPYIAAEGVASWLLGSVLGAGITLIAFAVAAWVIATVGMGFFNAEVTFYQMVRTLGLAYIWAIFGVLGVLGALSPTMTALVAPIMVITWLLAVIAWVFASKRALDLSWGKTLVTVLVGALIFLAIGELVSLALSGVGIYVPSLANALKL